jgi:hypothetical protein
LAGVLELEVLYSPRSHRDVPAIREELGGDPRLQIGDADFLPTLAVMERLIRRDQHRAAAVADLLQPALVEQRGVGILHYDADLELIAAVTGQPMDWVVPRGSAP